MEKIKIKIHLKNMKFLLKLGIKKHKTLLVMYLMLIPIRVMLPYSTLWIPRVIVKGITKQYGLSETLGTLGSLILVFLLFSCGKDYLEGRLNWHKRSFVNSMLVSVDEKTMTTDYVNVEGNRGQLMRQKAINAVYAVGQNIFEKYSAFIISLFSLILYGTTISNVNIFLLLIIILTSFIEYVLTIRANRFRVGKNEELSEIDRKLNYIESNTTSVQAAREVRLYKMNQMMKEIHARCLAERIQVEKSINKKEEMYDVVKQISSVIRTFLSYGYLAYLVERKIITVDSFVLYVGIVSGISQWVADTLSHASEIEQMHVYLSDYFTYTDLEERTKEENQPTRNTIPKIQFDHVSFRYEGAREDSIRDISFVINEGEKIALVGNNGAGKTTLVKLLSGLYYPTSGKILIDGIDLIKLNREDYWRNIATVFQDIMLLPVTIAQNISSCINEEINVDLVEKCIDQVGMKNRIDAIPTGIHTFQLSHIINGAVDFSGGEQQKLWLAKAIYKSGNLLILDEPTAALDPIAESGIYENYTKIINHATSLFISHRLASTSFCDRIIFMSDGQIQEMGTHKELMELNGAYYEMYHEQSKYYKDNYKEEKEL